MAYGPTACKACAIALARGIGHHGLLIGKAIHAFSKGESFLRRTLGFISGAVAAAALVAGCGKTYPVGALAPTPPPLTPQVTSVYTLPTSQPSTAQPEGLASASLDSNCSTSVIWFTLESANEIGTLNTAAKYTFEELPNANSQPYDITCGPDGQIWFTEYNGDRIGRFSTATGAFAEFAIPTGAAKPTAIVLGNDGGLWFTESASGKIGRIDVTSATITEYASGATTPFDDVVGSDGNVWFTAEGSDQVGKITSGGVVTLYTVTTPAAVPYAIVAGADHALWFTENAAGKLGRITPSNGQMTETALTACPAPTTLQQGVDGNFYIVCSGASPTMLQFNPANGDQKSFKLKSGSVPQWSIIAFDNKLYFTDSGLNAIDQFNY
jgi:streptogramin lyase